MLKASYQYSCITNRRCIQRDKCWCSYFYHDGDSLICNCKCKLQHAPARQVLESWIILFFFAIASSKTQISLSSLLLNTFLNTSDHSKYQDNSNSLRLSFSSLTLPPNVQERDRAFLNWSNFNSCSIVPIHATSILLMWNITYPTNHARP